METPNKFIDYLFRLKELATDQSDATLSEIIEGRLPDCGIVLAQVTLAKAILAGIPNLPPEYEKVFGDPGELGWSLDEAFSYINYGKIARDWGKL